MMTAQVSSGALLFALLIVDIWCLPVKNKGFSPGTSHDRSYSNAAPDSGLYQGVPSGHFSSGGVVPNNAPSTGVSTSYDVPELGPSAPQPTLERGPAPSVGFSSSGPVYSGYKDASVAPNPANFAQPGPAPGSHWAVAPPLPLSGGDEALVGVSGQPDNVSPPLPPLPPPGPMYQAGELSSFEKSFEHGNSEMETEEQGWLPALPPPPPLMAESAEKDFASKPLPVIPSGGIWGRYPYYYDFMFLTGQYPPGTVSHSSSSFEKGRDHWQEAHYERYHAPSNPGPVQQTETFTDFSDPQVFEEPETPVKSPVDAGYGQGGAPVGLPAPSYGGFRQPVHSQAGGHKGWY